MPDVRICVYVEVVDDELDVYLETGAVVVKNLVGVVVGDGTLPVLVEELRALGFGDDEIAEKVRSVNELLIEHAEAEAEIVAEDTEDSGVEDD